MMSLNQFGRLLKGVGADMNPLIKAGASRAIQKKMMGKKWPTSMKNGGGKGMNLRKAIKKVGRKLKK